jgi:hypothetical protein
MKSAIGALAFIGVIYASCAWFSTIGDYEFRFNEADRSRNWAVVSPPTLRFARQPSRSNVWDDRLEYGSLEYDGRAETTVAELNPSI